MRSRRLLWQLYPSYLIITLAALVAVGWFASRSLTKFHMRAVQNELFTQARLIAHQFDQRIDDETMPRLRAFSAELSQHTSTRVTIVDGEGKVLFDTHEDAGSMPNHAEREEIRAVLASGEAVGKSIRFSDTVKKRMLSVALPVMQGEQVAAVVRTGRPLETIEEEIVAVQLGIVGWGMLIALGAAVVSLLVARRISRPIEEIRKGAERFAAGDLDYKLPVPDSAEMAGLADSLNAMARQMQDRVDTIIRHRHEQEAVLGSMVEGVLAVSPDEKIISINRAAADLLRCDRRRAIGGAVRDVIAHDELRGFIARAVTCDEPIQQDVSLEGATERIILARGSALSVAGAAARGAVIVLNDVTNVRRLENVRRDFVANVSHELKTPITSIKGFVETLLDGALDNREDAERFLQIVAKQSDRLGAIVEDLLSLAKIEESEEALNLVLQPGNIRDVLEAAVYDVQPQALDRNVTIRLECDEPIEADINPPLLEQAVTNLLDNAIKYCGSDREVELRAEQRDGEVAISVTDHGPGIAPEHLPRLFERFYRVDKARSRTVGGTGLGLAIVKHIASAHRGRVTVTSTLGLGSTFTLLLPTRQQSIWTTAVDPTTDHAHTGQMR